MGVHHFEPQKYHSTIGQHESVLRIRSGDSVVTSTVDARGSDKNLHRAALGVNPMTGPFYIEEAEPGDTLAVCFDYLMPNRNMGWTHSVLSHQVIDPETFVELPPRELVIWDLDSSKRTVRLAKPTAGLGEFKQDMVPFLGCFGVAPARKEFISTASSGEYGGNMDYRKFNQGTTAYFPVSESGALLFMGDGHALQGDGEIVGTGIETSFDVQFTVTVIKGKSIKWPRGEDKDYIFTIGNIKPLEDAIKHATSEMVRWLNEDYGLDNMEASTLLGQCVEYDLGNIYNPTYTIVCKIRKSVITEISKKA